ncbi:hypothetical protein ACFQPA_12950 [Halomarina halobia]|uniref:Uncharacterized protein n=1 Tax=Halomarina halobia TaxID=3033386 RepID=A0ABD6AAF7_9EURY|nr:hypothetical protein [Halomarina sp. PSR21]
MQNVLVRLIESLPELGAGFAEIASMSVGQAVLLALGALLLLFSMGFFGYLVFGALVRPIANFATPGRGPVERREQEYREPRY